MFSSVSSAVESRKVEFRLQCVVLKFMKFPCENFLRSWKQDESIFRKSCNKSGWKHDSFYSTKRSTGLLMGENRVSHVLVLFSAFNKYVAFWNNSSFLQYIFSNCRRWVICKLSIKVEKNGVAQNTSIIFLQESDEEIFSHRPFLRSLSLAVNISKVTAAPEKFTGHLSAIFRFTLVAPLIFCISFS